MHRSAYFQRLLFIGLSGPIVALNLWILIQVFVYFQHLITVLLISAILAFLLNYPVQLLARFYRSRSQAVIVVLLVTLTIFLILGLTLVPLLTQQTAELLKNIPAWLQASNANLERWENWAKVRDLPLDLKGFSGRVSANIEGQVQILATKVPGFAIGTLLGLFDTILIIVLAFYMLLYGKSLWEGMVNLVPPEIGLPLSKSLRLNFQNFFISQILLALFMVGTLIPIFLVLKVPFALLFALLIGIGELIPFIGAALSIGLVTILVMLNNFQLGIWVAIAAIILQQIKDNLLAPRLMGEFIGLNPIVIFIALLVGGKIAGVLGVIIAVPIAGTIKSTIDTIKVETSTKVGETEKLAREPFSQDK